MSAGNFLETEIQSTTVFLSKIEQLTQQMAQLQKQYLEQSLQLQKANSDLQILGSTLQSVRNGRNVRERELMEIIERMRVDLSQKNQRIGMARRKIQKMELSA